MRIHFFSFACMLALVSAGCSRDPLKTSRNYLTSGDSYALAGKYNEAAIEYRNAAKVSPRFADPHLRLGQLAMNVSDVQTATAEYLRAVDLDPGNATAQVRAASVYLLAGRLADARAHAEAALRLEPDNADAHVTLGDALAALHDQVHSEAELIEAVRLAPKSPDAHAALGSLYWSMGRLRDAEAALKRAVELSPRPLPQFRMLLADVEDSLGKRADALSHLAVVVDNDPQNVAALLRRAQLLVADGKMADAQAAVDAANRVEPDSPRVMLARAEVLLRQGRADDGVWWALRTRERHPDDLPPLLRSALAQILEAGGRRKAAEQEYAAILKASPRDWIAANNLAWMYAADGRLDDALKLARVAHEEAPQNAQVNDTLASILKRKGG